MTDVSVQQGVKAAGKRVPTRAAQLKKMLQRKSGATIAQIQEAFGWQTLAKIAEAEGTSKRRVQDVVDLAMLAPDILELISKGEQPLVLTSNVLIKSGVPARWSEQRDLVARL